MSGQSKICGGPLQEDPEVACLSKLTNGTETQLSRLLLMSAVLIMLFFNPWISSDYAIQ